MVQTFEWSRRWLNAPIFVITAWWNQTAKALFRRHKSLLCTQAEHLPIFIAFCRPFSSITFCGIPVDLHCQKRHDTWSVTITPLAAPQQLLSVETITPRHQATETWVEMQVGMGCVAEIMDPVAEDLGLVDSAEVIGTTMEVLVWCLEEVDMVAIVAVEAFL